MSVRSEKVADRIKVVVAQTLETKVKDPRLGFVTITDVRVTATFRTHLSFTQYSAIMINKQKQKQRSNQLKVCYVALLGMI